MCSGPKNKYLDTVVAHQLGLTIPKPASSPRVTQLTDADTTLFRSCVGGLMYYVLDRSDAQLAVSISGSI